MPFDEIKNVAHDANEMWTLWKAFFLDLLNKHAPITNIHVKGNKIPYITSELKSMIRQRDYLRAEANKTGSCILRQAYNQMRTKVNHKLYFLRKNYYANKIEQHKDDLKTTWKILKSAMGKPHKTTGIKKTNIKGLEVTDKEIIAEKCNEHFVSIGDRLAKEIHFNDKQYATAHLKPATRKFAFKPITVTQVVKLLEKLINSKATGIHGIPNRALKDSAEIIAPSLTDIFNFSLASNVFPDDLKVGKIAPVHKSGDKDQLNNYRPISVLPTVARVFEKIIYGQLYEYFMTNKLLGNQQFGFRSPHSTALALSKSTSNWLLSMDKSNMNSVIFLDIKKAFDTVDQEILLNKLNCYGVSDEELLFFASYLQNRTQCCSINGYQSNLKEVICRVPQGSILGPLLFIIYMNDLPAYVQDANITMYADDTSLDKAIRSSQQLKEELIPAFSKVCKWLEMNKLSLNTVKTEFMIIGTSQRLNQLDQSPESTPYIIKIDGGEIRRVKSVKYLGMIVDDKLTWEQHIEYISEKIVRNIGILKHIRNFMPQESLLLLYHTLVEPYLRYCSIVWGQCSESLKDRLQTLQNKAARTIARVRYDEADHNTLLANFGWLSVRNLIKLDMGIFIYKELNNMHPERTDTIFLKIDNIHSHRTRSVTSNNLFIPRGNTQNFQKTMSYSGSVLWNEVPDEIRMTQTQQV